MRRLTKAGSASGSNLRLAAFVIKELVENYLNVSGTKSPFLKMMIFSTDIYMDCTKSLTQIIWFSGFSDSVRIVNNLAICPEGLRNGETLIKKG